MLLSAIGLHTPLSGLSSAANHSSSATSTAGNLLFSAATSHKPQHSITSSLKELLPTINATNSSASSLTTNHNSDASIRNPNILHHVASTLSDEGQEGGAAEEMVSSACAVASAITRGSTSQVEFVQRIEKEQKSKLVLPSSDFQRLCVQQLDLFRKIVDPDAILSVYVRPAGSYVMDRLELRRATYYPGGNGADIVILVGNFHIPTGLRAAEAAISSKQVEFVPEHRAAVFPMVKHPFVVGFLVAELPRMELETSSKYVHTERQDLIQLPSPDEAYSFPPGSEKKTWEVQNSNDESPRIYNFSAEQKSNAISISQSLAMAHVMDQKALLLQQSSWQNNVRMSNLVEQIRSPLSSIRTLSKMLSTHLRRSEIAFDIVEDIVVQGDRIRDTLQELQNAVHLTKANIIHYNEETLKKINNSTYSHPESARSQLSDNNSRDTYVLDTPHKDLEMPMPPLALAPLKQNGTRPCNVCEVLSDLVEAIRPLTHKQQCTIEFNTLSQSLQVAVEEPALRHALSNLIEGALLRTHVGGKVEIACTGAPAGGGLVVIDDDGPDMHYMTQMHSLTPFGKELLSENMIEDNMTWNFVAGLTVAREILESYGSVVRVISPRSTEAALGVGGTRIELWLPSLTALSDSNSFANEA